MKARVGLALALAALSGAACREETPADTPERVVQAFVDRMQGVHGDPTTARAAYDLLASESKENLGERARRASAVEGRRVGPEEMIAPSRFTLGFRPKRYAARVQGDTAIVTVTGELPSSDQAEVRCVREDGEWRVALELPELTPIQRRVDGGV